MPAPRSTQNFLNKSKNPSFVVFDARGSQWTLQRKPFKPSRLSRRLISNLMLLSVLVMAFKLSESYKRARAWCVLMYVREFLTFFFPVYCYFQAILGSSLLWSVLPCSPHQFALRKMRMIRICGLFVVSNSGLVWYGQ